MAIVRVLARAEIARNPEARVPENCVHQEIATHGKRRKEFPPASRRHAGREDGVGEVHSRRLKYVSDSAPNRAIAQIDFRLKQSDTSNNSQNEGPKYL